MTTEYRPCKLSFLRLWPYWQTSEEVEVLWEVRPDPESGALVFRPLRSRAGSPFVPFGLEDGDGSLRPVGFDPEDVSRPASILDVRVRPVSWATLEDLARTVREAREVPEASGSGSCRPRSGSSGPGPFGPGTCSGPPTCEPLSRGDRT